MPRAVKFWKYGGPEVLQLVEVERPHAAPGTVVVEVVTAALNPGEIGIRVGHFDAMWPATFPEGQGNDFAGYVAEVGEGVEGFAIGDQVLGFAPRAAQANFVVVGTDALAPKPSALSWEAAATIAGVGATAWAAIEAVRPGPRETVVVSAAAGGVGVIAAQLARLRGAHVIGTASEGNFALLRSLGVTPVRYGRGLADRISAVAPSGVDAYIDTFGAGNVDIAIGLGVRPDRINTLADGAAILEYGVHSDAQEEAASPALWATLAGMAAEGQFHIPIAQVYPLEEVRQAYRDVATRHTSGKRVLSIIAPGERRE
ncbi:NADP-dependent oxidoreductase [Rhodococcus wratislaviensis]|uniref:Putative oxidoreductase n=1 Tax=Rhodococcus wratislaviensis NBRC 100605 TaxID=1219028 RepID=X0Q308_RHOWR|nr:NADP-dependent oxidoreductase [Rhodococcus wratislaviensis]GAF45432.1 putative oxidoreductase [Rhodococcus wratislaviensis NBRC 100605]